MRCGVDVIAETLMCPVRSGLSKRGLACPPMARRVAHFWIVVRITVEQWGYLQWL